MFNDIYFYNKYYSEVGGVALNELNIMEEQFLLLLGYNLYIDEQTFYQYQ